jgi:hypothetical protein
VNALAAFKCRNGHIFLRRSDLVLEPVQAFRAGREG